ncbi:MAG: NADH-quinone oxidoreductase subunit H [Desulfovibrio sp.]|nr:NADH-quinone oxidoreductase subunit H [Desulfovibrio sp.]
MSARLLCAFAAFGFSLLFAPLAPGIINRVKAVIAGRQGRPLLLLYYDLRRLLRKEALYPRCSTFFFRLAPAVGVCAGITALLLVPFGPMGSCAGFPGDFVLVAGVFAVARFTLMTAAMDTGSAFEGMGAAREAFFSALAEPVLLFCPAVLCFRAGVYSLAAGMGSIPAAAWFNDATFYLTTGAALFLVLLQENCRLPADDPDTHLELTMIHEVMILDHSGPDLAFLEYASALKLWTFCLLTADMFVPLAGGPLFDAQGALLPDAGGRAAFSAALTFAGAVAVAVLVGLVESVTARFRMERVPQICALAGGFICLAALAYWRTS